MNHSTLNILDLSDEILLFIFNKLNETDVLYSILGVHERLDKLARDMVFTRSVDLSTISSIDENNLITNKVFNRFCSDILPQIHHNVQCLTLQTSSLEHVLYAGNYPVLHKLTLLNLKLELASLIFSDESPFAHIFKYQISHLNVSAAEDSTIESIRNLVTHIYARIFALLTNLKHLDFTVVDYSLYMPPRLSNFPSTTCYSSSIVYLCVRVHTLDDCLCLLDGRLSQLHTFIVKIDETENSSVTINNTNTLWKLKYFSLSLFSSTNEYDGRILTLLQRMTQLEKLTLSLVVEDRSSFIDGTHLNNEILSKMPCLHTFIFDIVSKDVVMEEDYLPTSDDIRGALIQKGHDADCYIDYYSSGVNRCHLYSVPLYMEHMHSISNNFPGGLFIHVRILRLFDVMDPFEHDFFARISHAFPLINSMSVSNIEAQLKKRSNHLNEHEQTSSIIEYSHLTELDVSFGHIDYVEQFLLDTNTRLPSLKKLRISYEHLISVTENFTNDSTRTNCAQLKRIIPEYPMVYARNFELHPPYVNILFCSD